MHLENFIQAYEAGTADLVGAKIITRLNLGDWKRIEAEFRGGRNKLEAKEILFSSRGREKVDEDVKENGRNLKNLSYFTDIPASTWVEMPGIVNPTFLIWCGELKYVKVELLT